MSRRERKLGACGLLVVGSSMVSACGGVATGDVGAGPSSTQASTAEPLVLASSGARLFATAYELASALRFRHFEDSALGISCAFSRDSNGDLRCLPQQQAPLLYLDAACSAEPATWNGWPSGGPHPVGSWLVDEVDEPCPGELPRHRAYRLGEQVRGEAIETAGVYELIEGRCQPARQVGKGNPPVNRLLPQAPESFVSASLRAVAVSPQLSVRQIVASDGARLNLDVTTHDGTACALHEGACIPAPLAEPGGAMVDASCNTPGYYQPRPACGAPRYALSSEGRVLELRRAEQLYSRGLGAPVPAGHEPELVCERTRPSIDIWEGGRDVTGSFPIVEMSTLGDGSLRAGAIRLRGPGGDFTLPDRDDPRVFLTTRGRCRVVTLRDGREHCLDEAYSPTPSGFYSDPSCSSYLFEGEGDPTRMLYAVHQSQDEVAAVYALTPYRGAVYAYEGDSCQRVSPDLPLLAGERLPDDTFPLVQQVRLPREQ